ncbi:MAG: hypothetical protein Ct9H300mP11_22460 [Chloroflexota bacterium]|nr:MAG: hypothetical protein Ct9H300mP11_22460 [Chloroflexota bacterium]
MQNGDALDFYQKDFSIKGSGSDSTQWRNIGRVEPFLDAHGLIQQIKGTGRRTCLDGVKPEIGFPAAPCPWVATLPFGVRPPINLIALHRYNKNQSPMKRGWF